MIAKTTLSSKFQTTLPKGIAKRLGAKPSDRIIYQCEGPIVFLRIKNMSFKDAVSRFKKKGQVGASLEEIQQAIELGGESWAPL